MTREVAGGREYGLELDGEGYVIAYDGHEYAEEAATGILDDEDLEAWRRRNRGEENEEGEETPAPSPAPEPEPEKTEPFRSFNEQTDSMAWPLQGDIVMNYSTDRLIYDKTLEQYRTNNNICISAQIGAPVMAAADGIVLEIFSTREGGKMIVIDHGNGWRTTYGQLQDDSPVRTGDVVQKGQKIATVGNPSIHSSQLGPHLSFMVSNEQGTVNPAVVLR